MERNFEERKGALGDIFEKKRHYEQEIEALKRDLELIEQEEQRIKSKLMEKTLQDLYPSQSSNFERGALKDRYPGNEITYHNELVVEDTRKHEIDHAFDSFIQKRSNNQQAIVKSYEFSEPPLEGGAKGWEPPSFCNS